MGYPDEVRERARELHGRGLSVREIERELAGPSRISHVRLDGQACLALNRPATQVEGVRAWGEAVSVVPKSRTLFPLNCHKASFHAPTVCRLVLSRVATCAHVAFRYRGVFSLGRSKSVLTCTHR